MHMKTTIVLLLACLLVATAWAQKPGFGRGEYFNVIGVLAVESSVPSIGADAC